MKNYITVILFALLSFCSVYSVSAQDTGEVVVSGDEDGGRSTSENIRVFKNAQSIDVYIFGHSGSVSISVENEAGQTVTSASTVSLEDGRMSQNGNELKVKFLASGIIYDVYCNILNENNNFVKTLMYETVYDY